MSDRVVLVEGREAFLPPPDPAGPTDAEIADLIAGAPPHWREEAALDPVDVAVAQLRRADRAMAVLLRAMADAGPADGLPARRLVALRAGATRGEVAFLERVVQTLSAMPRTQAAFDDGGLSWSQVRGIVMEARRLSVAHRAALDAALAGVLVQARDRGEPDRVVEVAGDIAARLDPGPLDREERSGERSERIVVQHAFDGWADIFGTLAPDTAAIVSAALDAAADAPVAPKDPPATDDDGQALPAALQRPPSRGWQWAMALRRIAEVYLGGGGPVGPCTCGVGRHAEGCLAGLRRRARPSMTIVANLQDLIGEGEGVGSVTSRLLLRRGDGRRRISRALTRRLLQDADVIGLFTDDDSIPVAIGDSYAEISPALRRAVLARDQGCRAPGCTAPAEHVDVHHIIPREQGGRTELCNLGGLCRRDHTCLTDGRWTMDMDPDGTMHFHIGGRTYITRPRLTPPGRPPG